MRSQRLCFILFTDNVSSILKVYTLRANELIQYLNDRGYNLSFLKHEIRRVRAITRDETLKPNQVTSNQCSRVPLLITYNPALHSISSIIRKHFSILSSSPRYANVFKSIPLALSGSKRRPCRLQAMQIVQTVQTEQTEHFLA